MMNNAAAIPDDIEETGIRTYSDLLEEEQRLRIKLKQTKEAVNSSLHALREKVEPASQMLQTMNSVMGINKKPGLVAQGVDMAIDLITKKYMFRHTGWLMTLVGSYAVRGLSQFIIGSRKGKRATKGTVPVSNSRSAIVNPERLGHNGIDA